MKALTVILSVLLLVAIIALHIPASSWWGFSVIGLFSPFLWLLNLLLLLYWLWKPSWWLSPTVVALIAGTSLIGDTVSFSAAADPPSSALQVLTYNVSHFGKPKGYNFERDSSKLEDVNRIRAFVDWVTEHPAPVKCFQEFFTFPGNALFDVDKRLKEQGWSYVALSTDTLSVNKSRFGLATYSKYPILAQGVIFIGSSRFNRGIWSDIKVGQDTLRVLNVHMQSAQLQRTSKKNRSMKDKLRKMFWMYRASLRAQNDQLEQVMSFVQESPHPILLAGDLNSHPFSRVYQVLDKELDSAFEQKGNGFGFTFNHPKLFFLRIDHQFVSKELKTVQFRTRQDIGFSEHFPLEGWYMWEKAVDRYMGSFQD